VVGVQSNRARNRARIEQEIVEEKAQMIAGAAAIAILLMRAGVHLYWAAGGKAGKSAAVPSANGRPLMRPSAFGTAMVAVGLCVMAALLAQRIGWLNVPALPGSGVVVRVGAWLIATVFALRAIGDFRYVGFFKRIRDSRFARLDTLAYSPLCACLALLAGISAST
jgi:Protein of unknown function (DUF3995)